MSTDTPTQTPEEQQQANVPEVEQSSTLPELTLGTGAPAEAGTEVAPAPVILRGKLDKDGTAIGTGRRKTSVARVRVKDGSGNITVNGRPFEDYFRIERDRLMIQQPLDMAEVRTSIDISVRVDGGGSTGQTGAVILGIARALEARNPSLHHKLSENGYLTRDDRMVERKKYGRRKARRSFQFSKR